MRNITAIVSQAELCLKFSNSCAVVYEEANFGGKPIPYDEYYGDNTLCMELGAELSVLSDTRVILYDTRKRVHGGFVMLNYALATRNEILFTTIYDHYKEK